MQHTNGFQANPYFGLTDLHLLRWPLKNEVQRNLERGLEAKRPASEANAHVGRSPGAERITVVYMQIRRDRKEGLGV